MWYKVTFFFLIESRQVTIAIDYCPVCSCIVLPSDFVYITDSFDLALEHMDVAWFIPHLVQLLTKDVSHFNEKWFFFPHFVHDSPYAGQRDWIWPIPQLLQLSMYFTLELFVKWLNRLCLHREHNRNRGPQAGHLLWLYSLPYRVYSILIWGLTYEFWFGVFSIFRAIKLSHCFQNRTISLSSNDCKYGIKFSPLLCMRSAAFPVKRWT